MLYFSRWKAIAIVAIAAIICLCAVPNFFSPQTVARWPEWAQRHVVLGLDLQGGSHILLEVDANDVRQQKLDQVRDDVRRVLRDAKIGYTGLVIRGDTVEVRIRDGSDIQTAYSKLRELSVPLGGLLGGTGQRSLDVSDAGNGLVRLTVTEAAMTERIRQVVEQTIPIIEKRVNELGLVEPTVQRQGIDRVLVQVPGLGDPEALLRILGKTAKLEFRLVDVSNSPQDALQGRVPPDDDLLYETRGGQKVPILVQKQVMVSGADLTDAQPGFDQRSGEPIVTFRFNTAGARRFAQVSQENVGRPFAIVLDGEVISAPVIREAILGGSGQISGSFTVESANELAILLRAGALPAKLTPIEQRVVGPGLGQEFDPEGQARLLRGRRPGRRIHVRDLRAVRPVRQHRRRGQRGDDLRGAFAVERDPHVARHRRDRAHGRYRGQLQRADLRAHPRRGARRPLRDFGDRRRLFARACDHSRFEHYDLHRSCGIVRDRDRARAGLCGYAGDWYRDQPVHRLHADAVDRCDLGAMAAPEDRANLI